MSIELDKTALREIAQRRSRDDLETLLRFADAHTEGPSIFSAVETVATDQTAPAVVELSPVVPKLSLDDLKTQAAELGIEGVGKKPLTTKKALIAAIAEKKAAAVGEPAAE